MAKTDNNNSLQDILLQPEHPGPGLLEYLQILSCSARLIVSVLGVTVILSLLLFLVWPKTYVATARILPPMQQKTGLGTMLTGVSDLAALAGIDVGGGSGDFYIGILKSRSVADRVIDNLDLMAYYGTDTRVETYETLNDLVHIASESDEGIIAINVEDHHPGHATDIANAFVAELMRMHSELALSDAGRRRLFLENSLQKARRDLYEAEEALSSFLQKHDLIKVDDEASAMIDALAELRTEIATSEVQLAVLLSYQTEENLEVKSLRAKIAQLKSEMKKLERFPSPGLSDQTGDTERDAAPPEIVLKYGRLLRDVKTEEAVFAGLTQQYELARIEEAKEGSPIQVLDHALPPDKHSSPKAVVFFLIPIFGALVVTIGVIFIREYIARMDEEDRRRLDQLLHNLRGDLLRIRR